MSELKLLESYKSKKNTNQNPEYLDNVAKEFKNEIKKHISVNFFDKFIKESSTRTKLNSNLDKHISIEFNSISIPYFYILESLNLCVEVEMSDDHSKFLENQKFGHSKFSDILNKGGFDEPEPIKKFAISEKKFFESLLGFISNYTQNFEVYDDSIKIEII